MKESTIDNIYDEDIEENIDVFFNSFNPKTSNLKKVSPYVN